VFCILKYVTFDKYSSVRRDEIKTEAKFWVIGWCVGGLMGVVCGVLLSSGVCRH